MSSKECSCGNTELVLLSTYREKFCCDCNTFIFWPLDDGQTPVHGEGKSVARKQQEKQGNAIYRGEKVDARGALRAGSEVAQAPAQCERPWVPDSGLGVPLGLEW